MSDKGKSKNRDAKKNHHQDTKPKESGSKTNGAEVGLHDEGVFLLGKDCGYEKELARLQIELVKLQEWIKNQNLRVVVLFEGRDAAGKGGAIKRITESLNPRICRVVALGTPTEREKSQWYFQRYVPHLPAVGEMVLFDRSWYNRSGVEHVMGFCNDHQYQEFMQSCPEFERMLVRSGIVLKVLVLSERLGTGAPFSGPHEQADQALEAEPDGPRIAQALGRIFARQGRNVRDYRHQAVPVVCGQRGKQEDRAAQRHPPSAVPDSVQGPYARTVDSAAAGEVEVRSPADARAELYPGGLPVGLRSRAFAGGD